MIENFPPTDCRRQIFEFYRNIEKNTNSRLENNYSDRNFDLDDQNALTYYKKDESSDPSIFSTIFRRKWWPAGAYRILNRTWQYPRNTKFEKTINSGLYEMIDEQLRWCKSLPNFKTAIITRDKNTKLFDKMITDLKLQNIIFKKANNKIWVSRDMSQYSELSYQHVLYHGDDQTIENWDPSFTVAILSWNHYQDIKEIYHANNKSKAETHEKSLKLTDRYFSALEKYYLIENDKDHILFGLFANQKLVAYAGIRFDLPKEYNEGWIVSYLKISPDINVITNGGLRKLWLEIFDHAEARGKTKWHSIIDKDRQQNFDSFGIRQIPEINDRYEFSTLCEIPQGAKPEIDWVYAMMGRMTHHDKSYIVRTAILKHYS